MGSCSKLIFDTGPYALPYTQCKKLVNHSSQLVIVSNEGTKLGTVLAELGAE